MNPLWSRALSAASQLQAAADWRQQLAEGVRQAAGARFAAVFTCPPGNPFQAAPSVDPVDFAPLIQHVAQHLLPEIERAGVGMAWASTLGASVYAPTRLAAGNELAATLQRDVLSPAGLDGLVNVFLVAPGQAALGWITLGSAEPAEHLLAACHQPLAQVAERATRTLLCAASLAAACGARLPEPAGTTVTLSVREQQIASLVSSGLSDVNVALTLSISEETVGSHLRRIYKKLGVHSRGELTARYFAAR